jgi:uncharacterized protein
MENNRIVIDTNVLISALIGQQGYPFKIFDEIILTGEVVICLSEQLLKEYEAVSQRERFKKIPGFSNRAIKFIKILKEISFFVDPQEIIYEIADDPDNRVLEVAVTANASVIVTGNTNDFSFSEFRGIKIQTPRAFYESFINN